MLLAALATARRALPLYSHRNSPKKFTQHQLFACLVLKIFLKTDYRGVAAHLADCPSLTEVLGLARVPHYTTDFDSRGDFQEPVSLMAPSARACDVDWDNGGLISGWRLR